MTIFIEKNDQRLPKLPLKAFAARLFNHTPLLHQYRSEVDRLTAEFKSYKQEVPTCGAAMLNEELDKVLVVRGWGTNAKWGFPKGKVAKDETELQAAIREVLEETGFDFSDYADESTYYIDSMAFGRLNRIFVVPGVPEDTHFETQTRKEISDMAWIPVDALPEYQKNKDRNAPPPPDIIYKNGRIPYNKIYFHVAPYSVRLKSWVKRQRKKRGEAQRCSKASSSARKSGAVDKMQGSESARAPQGSPPRSKRNKDKRKQDNKDVETFGTEGEAGCLSAAQRDSLFQNYVRDADKRAKELCLGEDMWPTALPGRPLAGSGVRDGEVAEYAQSAQALGAPALRGWTENGEAGSAEAGSAEVDSGQTEGIETSLFTFDTKAILARMLDG